MNFTVYFLFPDSSGNQLGRLRPKIKDYYFFAMNIHGFSCLLHIFLLTGLTPVSHPHLRWISLILAPSGGTKMSPAFTPFYRGVKLRSPIIWCFFGYDNIMNMGFSKTCCRDTDKFCFLLQFRDSSSSNIPHTRPQATKHLEYYR